MNLLKLHEVVKSAIKNTLINYEDPAMINVCIEIKGSGFGGTKVDNVKCAYLGFDWDKGKFIIVSENELTEVC
jgi:hypothetical protein